MLNLLLNSILLGIGLAMDACAVSMANGLSEPKMKTGKMFLIAAVFGVFQFAMPFAGWICIKLVEQQFVAFSNAVPYIALILLSFIGGKMLFEGFGKKKNADEDVDKTLTFFGLLTQAVATSIDALSVGFTVAQYQMNEVLISAGVIGIVTFGICVGSVAIGKKFGTKLGNKAEIFGGFLLIAIGLKIFIEGLLG